MKLRRAQWGNAEPGDNSLWVLSLGDFTFILYINIAVMDALSTRANNSFTDTATVEITSPLASTPVCLSPSKSWRKITKGTVKPNLSLHKE